MHLAPTQWFSFIISILIMSLSLYWRKKEYFYLIFPVLFLSGLHMFLFYSLYGLTSHTPTEFSFHTWSQALRLHTQLSILIIMFTRHSQMKELRRKQQETLEVLKKNGNGHI